MRSFFFPALVALVALVGCATTAASPKPFAQQYGQYKADLPIAALLGSDWVLDSHYLRDDDTLVLKNGSDYSVEYELDVDGDGDSDIRRRFFLYDLRWEHAIDSSAIWIRTIPIPDKFTRKDPKVLLADYVERIAGSGVEFVKYGDTLVAKSARYGTSILNARDVVVANRPAHAVEIEVVNLDQHELSNDSQRHRVLLVLLHQLSALQVDGAGPVPTVLLAAYAARPDDYSKHLTEFEQLLGRLDLGRGPSRFRSRESVGAAPVVSPESAASPVAE